MRRALLLAACLLDGDVRLSTFSDEAVARPEAQSLLRRVTIEESAAPPFGDAHFDKSFATLEVTRQDGSTLRERCDVPRGDARAPLSDSELEAKFRDCLAFSQTNWDADALLATLSQLGEAHSVRLS